MDYSRLLITYENVRVGNSLSLPDNFGSDQSGAEGTSASASTQTSGFSIVSNTVTGNGLDWLQVQKLPGYESVCEGSGGCLLPSGSYIVINHTTGVRSEPFVIPGQTAP